MHLDPKYFQPLPPHWLYWWIIFSVSFLLISMSVNMLRDIPKLWKVRKEDPTKSWVLIGAGFIGLLLVTLMVVYYILMGFAYA